MNRPFFIEWRDSRLSALWAVILVTAAAFGSLAMADEPDNELELKILADRQTYSLNEPVIIDILVISQSDDTVWLEQMNQAGNQIRLLVVSSGVDSLAFYRSLVVDIAIPMDRYLAPYDTAYAMFFLVGNAATEDSNPPLDVDPLEGRVDVTGFYLNHIISNTLSLCILRYSSFGGDLARRSRQPVQRLSAGDLVSESLINDSGTHRTFTRETAIPGLSAAGGDLPGMSFVDHWPGGYSRDGDIWSLVWMYIGGSTEAERDAKLDSLMAPDRPFRLRMIARNIKRRL